MVSSLTVRSLIHFEFIFVYGVRKCCNLNLLHVVVQFSQHHLAALFTIAKTWKQPKCPSSDKRIKMWCIHIQWNITQP